MSKSIIFCYFCQKQMVASSVELPLFKCHYCPNNVNFNARTHIVRCYVSYNDINYYARWDLVDLSFELYCLNGGYNSILKIEDGMDNITPYNIQEKIPILILFS